MQELLLGNKEEKEEKSPYASLRMELLKIQRELEQAEELFNNVTEVALLDTSIYRIRALTSYREYLIRTAKEEFGAEAVSESAVPL